MASSDRLDVHGGLTIHADGYASNEQGVDPVADVVRWLDHSDQQRAVATAFLAARGVQRAVPDAS